VPDVEGLKIDSKLLAASLRAKELRPIEDLV
jgi:hypothetical protein